MSKIFTWTELSKHNDKDDLYLSMNGSVYDVTKFQHEHPGGSEFLLDQGGKDVKELFEDAGHSESARALLPDLKVGMIKQDKSTKAYSEPKSSQRETSSTAIVSNEVMMGIVLVAALLLSWAYYMTSVYLFQLYERWVESVR